MAEQGSRGERRGSSTLFKPNKKGFGVSGSGQERYFICLFVSIENNNTTCFITGASLEGEQQGFIS